MRRNASSITIVSRIARIVNVKRPADALREHVARSRTCIAVELLLQNLARLRMNLFVIDVARVPSAAEGFDQVDGADHLLTKQLRGQPLAVEQSRLRGDDVEIRSDSTNVAI